MAWVFMAAFDWGDLVKLFSWSRAQPDIMQARNSKRFYSKVFMLGWMSFALSGCAIMTEGPADYYRPAPSVQSKTLPSAVISQHEDRLSQAAIKHLMDQSITYHLGPGDVVSVSVYTHPNLSVPTRGATTALSVCLGDQRRKCSVAAFGCGARGRNDHCPVTSPSYPSVQTLRY